MRLEKRGRLVPVTHNSERPTLSIPLVGKKRPYTFKFSFEKLVINGVQVLTV